MIEADLLKIYDKLNEKYFQSSIFVSRIKFVRFLVDAITGGVTYGEFRYEGGSNSEILVNRYMILPPIIKVYPWMPELLLYHEMCHAMLVLNKFPQRYGKYTCEAHGSEFWDLMLKHPKAKEFDTAKQQVFTLMRSTFEREATTYLNRHPKTANKLLKMHEREQRKAGS